MLTICERNELIVDNMNFAEKLARFQFKKTPSCVQFDELKSAAYMGLVDAASKYDGSKPFQLYASFRIFGEIKDYLRSLFWNGRGKNVKVSSWQDHHDVAEVADNDNFDDFLNYMTDNKVSELARNVLRMYYGEDLTMKQIATSVGLSASRIYQILQTSLQEIRQNIERN